jgi:hypothetical protein
VRWRHLRQGEYLWAKEHWKQFTAQQVAELLVEIPRLANEWWVDDSDDQLSYERWEVTTTHPAAGVTFDEASGQWTAVIWPAEESTTFATSQDAKDWVDAGLTKRGWLLL